MRTSKHSKQKSNPVPAEILKHIIQVTLQSKMNAKLSKHRFWLSLENGLIKMIQTIPHNL